MKTHIYWRQECKGFFVDTRQGVALARTVVWIKTDHPRWKEAAREAQRCNEDKLKGRGL